ncbi:MAG: CHASE2 domain-containing protein [Cyanobacteria bacterium]|nr:CHASE2 domain-containing protein [Cyanobacteriota bacterium]
MAAPTPPAQRPSALPARAGRGWPWRRVATQLGPYAAAALVLLVLQSSRLIQTANLLLYDLTVRLRPAPNGAATPVRLIAIDERDLQQLGWPLDDALLIRAIQRLDQAGVAVIGLDLYRDIGEGDAHQALRQLSRSNPRLVSVFSHVEGIRAIQGTPLSRQAYNDLVVDPDDVVRRDLLFVRGMGSGMVPLPLRMLEVGHGGRPLREALERDPAWIQPLQANSGGYHGLDHGGVQRMLAFHRLGSFPSWSLRELLAGQVPEGSLRGSLVLIGSEAPSLRDGFRVPFAGPQPGRSLRLAGVELHAHRLAALIALQGGRPLGLRAAPPWLNTTLLVAAVLAGVALGEGIGALRRSQITVLAVATGMVVVTAASLASGWWFDAASPLAALAAAAWTRRAQEQQQHRQELQGLLQQTTSTSVAGELWRQRELLLEGGRFPGRKIELTVLFTDIEHFTRVAEQLDPEALLAWLNRGMAAMVGPVQGEGGLVNKFTGRRRPAGGLRSSPRPGHPTGGPGGGARGGGHSAGPGGAECLAQGGGAAGDASACRGAHRAGAGGIGGHRRAVGIRRGGGHRELGRPHRRTEAGPGPIADVQGAALRNQPRPGAGNDSGTLESLGNADAERPHQDAGGLGAAGGGIRRGRLGGQRSERVAANGKLMLIRRMPAGSAGRVQTPREPIRTCRGAGRGAEPSSTAIKRGSPGANRSVIGTRWTSRRA